MLALRNSPGRYGLVASVLHWLIALSIIALLIVGFYMTGLPLGPDKLRLIALHKACGICVLALACCRLLWRLSSTLPGWPLAMPRAQQIAAQAGHWLLYFFMFAQPLSGWLMSSAAGFPVSLFGLFTLPALIKPNPTFRVDLTYAHQALGYALAATVIGHTLAALYHHVIVKDDILKRMLPWGMALMLALLPMTAMAKTWQINPDQSTIAFTATEEGAPITGNFQKFSGSIDFDPDHLDQSHVKIVIDMGSVTASYEQVAASLQTPDWFAAISFPEATFECGSFSKDADGTYKAEGTLTIRGQSVPTTLSFTLPDYSDKAATVTGSTILKRTDFGIGQGAWAKTDQVKDEVTVNFTIKATPAP